MSFFSKLFGSPKKETPDISAFTQALAQPALQLLATAENSEMYFGGQPRLPKDFPWPQKNQQPLEFLCWLDLRIIQQQLPFSWLPKDGFLAFFYDVYNQPWGFDPADAGSWQVLYFEQDQVLEHRNPPENFTPELSQEKYFLSSRLIQSLPSLERSEVNALGLSEAAREEWLAQNEQVYAGDPKHQIGGYPFVIQNDSMELEAQLVSHGLYCGDATGYQDAKARVLEAGAADWRLLLQFDSDDIFGTCWGDLGTLYFWIREEDAKAKRFDKAWLILQCS
jgi:uncharacterized protein YwqG